MSEGSQTGISLIKEAEFAVTPNSQFKGMNFVSEDLKFSIENKSSNTVRPDRQNAGVIRTGANAAGGINTEFQATNVDYILPSFLWADADWTTPGTLNNPTTFAAELTQGAGGIITFNAADTIDILVGQYFVIGGALNSENNGIFRAKAVSGKNVTVNSPLVNESNTANVTLSGDRIRNGVTKQSFSIQRALYDVSQFFIFKGMTPNEWEMKVDSEEIIESNFTFVGKDDDTSDTEYSNGSPTALSTLEPMSSSVSVGGVFRSDSEFAGCEVAGFDFKLNNQAEGRKCVGLLGNGSVRGKSIELTGSITLYFTDRSEYAKYRAGTSFSFWFSLFDEVGNIYIISFPNLKYDDAAVNVTGKDDDVMFESTFIASLGEGEHTIEVVRVLI